MIVFVDGVDGSGKTTLITTLAISLAEHHRSVRVARPLWTFLTIISSPGEFANWVTSTPGSWVAEELLTAMTRRVNYISRNHTDEGVLLVDRGPKTVDSSARAHAGALGTSSPQVRRSRQHLVEAMVALTSRRRCVSIELSAGGSHQQVVQRLNSQQSMLPRYRTYLAAFNADMTTSPAWPGLPTVVLNALDPEPLNGSEAMATITQHLSFRSPAER